MWASHRAPGSVEVRYSRLTSPRPESASPGRGVCPDPLHPPSSQRTPVSHGVAAGHRACCGHMRPSASPWKRCPHSWESPSLLPWPAGPLSAHMAMFKTCRFTLDPQAPHPTPSSNAGLAYALGRGPENHAGPCSWLARAALPGVSRWDVPRLGTSRRLLTSSNPFTNTQQPHETNSKGCGPSEYVLQSSRGEPRSRS